MKLPVAIFCAAAFALSGCSTASTLFAANDPQPSVVELANAYVPVTAPIPSDFCQRVGSNARQEALADGFDAATQERLALVSVRQCQSFATQQVAFN